MYIFFFFFLFKEKKEKKMALLTLHTDISGVRRVGQRPHQKKRNKIYADSPGAPLVSLFWIIILIIFPNNKLIVDALSV